MGHVASTDSIAGSSGFRMKPTLFSKIRFVSLLFALLSFSVPLSAIAQSGRNTVKTPKPAPVKRKPVPGPVGEPSQSTGTPSSNPQPPAKSSRPRSVSDEVDPSDTVRVSSNLVPIPASVVDSKGYAITGLKLEDFELRIDGQLRAISDLTRSETSVRLVMLFDNSGSVDFAREFEKR